MTDATADRLVALKHENARLRDALNEISHTTTSMPPAYGNEADWYRGQLYDAMHTAARALATTPTTEEGA